MREQRTENSEQRINLQSLPKTTSKGKKRVGRGYGSGKGGHTSGRGQKGQKSRRTIPWWFEGGQLPLVKRVPFWRGKGRLNPLKNKPVIVKTGQFNKLKSGAVVTIDTLIQERMVNEAEVKSRGVKILAGGKLVQKLTIVGLKLSAGAKKEVEKVGGKAEGGLRPRVGRAQGRSLGVPTDFSGEKSGPARKKPIEKKPLVKKTVVKKTKKSKTKNSNPKS